MIKNLAGQSIGIQMITASDGSNFTGAVSVSVTIDNGVQTAGAGTAPAHEGNGYHSYSPTQAETNGDHIALTFTGTGAITATVQTYTFFPQTVDNATNISAILIDTAEIGVAGSGLTNINLPNQTMNITGSITSVTNPVTVGTINANVINAASIAANALNAKGDWNIGKTGYSISGTKTTLDALNDIAASSIVSAGAINTLSGSIVNVNNCLANSDMRGTDSALLASSAPTNFSSMVISINGSVDSLTQGFLNTNLSETTLGNISSNFDNFYDNANALTVKVVDDVGSGGGSGTSDWTTAEKSEIRGRLGITGAILVGGNTPTLATQSSINGLNDFDPLNDSVATVTNVTNTVNSNLLSISGDLSSSSNLRDTYNGVGYSDNVAPSTQESVGNISSGSSSISVAASSSLLTTGTEVNTFSSTEQKDGTYHEISDTLGAVNIYYEFDVGGNGIGSEFVLSGRLNGQNDSIIVQAFDWGSSTWSQIGDIQGTNSTTDSQSLFNILNKHTGTGLNIGLVRIRFFSSSGLTSSTLFIDQLFLSFAVVSNSVGYDGGQVWIDTLSGGSGTEPFVNGVADNPSIDFPSALTIASNLGLHQFRTTNDSSITLTSSFNNSIINFNGGVLDLNSQDVSGSIFNDVNISGVAINPTSEFTINRGFINNITVNNLHLVNSRLNGTILFGQVSSNVIISNCHSGLPSASFPVVDFGTLLFNHDLTITNYHNAIEIRNFNVAGGGVDTMSITGVGEIIIASNCDGGTINILGDWKITDNSGGLVTIVYDDNTTDIKNQPSNNELNQRTLLSTDYFNPTTDLVEISQASADKVWLSSSRTLTSFSFTVNCDVKLINGTTVIGNGTALNLWRA